MTRHRRLGPAAAIGLLAAAGCTSPLPVDDPLATLRRPGDSPRRYAGAMLELDQRTPPDEAYLDALEGLLWRPGYLVETREAAFERLLAADRERLMRTIRLRLPRLGARAWQERLCRLIVEHDWVELTAAIVSAWARRIGYVADLDRVEYQALVALHGEGNVIDVVFELLVESNKPYQQGLRTRCWELLQRLGERQRLVELVRRSDVPPGDGMLLDLRAAAAELGIVPRNREEILWIRKLREPERAEFWSQATAAVQGLPAARRAELELRDLPIVVAAALHEPELLDAEAAELYERLTATLKGRRKHVDKGRFRGQPGAWGQYLYEHRAALTWGDLAAMLLALRAAGVAPVVEHLFDYAERDRQDESCEYGGVIRLDAQGRFEILEFPPRLRRHDNEFIASQAMMDAGYTAVFHFHMHAQRHDNARYAGPGLGDVNYAGNTRTNCLVFTYVNKDTFNMDFYRHSRVIVDLGEVPRP